MAKGLCSNKDCRVLLTADNCKPSVLRDGFGYCRSCKNSRRRAEYEKSPALFVAAQKRNRRRHPEKGKTWRKKHARQERERSKKYNRTPEGRLTRLRTTLKFEGVPKTDPI